MRFYKERFRKELKNKGYAISTIESYIYSIEKFEQWYENKKNNIDDKKVGLLYLKHLKKRTNKTSSLNGFIQPLKLYCKLFRKENPFHYINFRRKSEKIKDNCFTKEELVEIYNSYPQETITQRRDKVLLGLYIFQGIQSKEIKYIEIKDICFDKYFIHLKGDNRTNQRKIALDIQQILLLTSYINEDRKKLLQNSKEQRLIITSKKINNIDSIIWSLSKKLKKSIYGFENFNQIRKSVVKLWIEQYDLRKAQYLSGHKYIGSTERFVVHTIEGLTKEVNKYFPLDEK